jgi:hypothetical protein
MYRDIFTPYNNSGTKDNKGPEGFEVFMSNTIKFSNPDIFREIQRMGVTDKYSPAYVGRVRSGYDRSEELAGLIERALARLKTKAEKAQAKTVNP